MKKGLKITFSRLWLYKHIRDEVYPIDYLKSGLQGAGVEFEVLSATADCIEISFSETADIGGIKDKVSEILKGKYADIDGVIDFVEKNEESAKVAGEKSDMGSTPAKNSGEEKSNDEKKSDETPSGDAPKTEDEKKEEKADDKKSEDAQEEQDEISQFLSDILHGIRDDEKKQASSSEDKTSEILAEIDESVGCDDFKALSHEISMVLPSLIESDMKQVFASQSYLFSINDGYGLSDYLKKFAKLLQACGLNLSSRSPIIELKVEPENERNKNPFDSVRGEIIRRGDEDYMKIMCIDISDWMNTLTRANCNEFLREAEKATGKFIFVFRVPFVEKDVLGSVKSAIGDVMYTRDVSFPPLTMSEIKLCATRELNRYGFKLTNSAWKFFAEKVSEEKSDGKFYGMATVHKIINELLYNKQLSNAKNKKIDKTIGANDVKKICTRLDESKISGFEMLDNLVGSVEFKNKIKEIITQIELASQTEEKPCMHMRFLGNPGTGKTTVARIIGKILRERGVLRIGGFHEVSGRDLCGRYVGETAPKTTSICRDAYGSILFIDEAYSLYQGDSGNDFGKEAVDTLIAEMENHRDDLVVIMAGYTKDMDNLLKVNLGLASRIPYTIDFPNFTREELYLVFEKLATSKYRYEKEFLTAAHEYFVNLPDEMINDEKFSNARFARNLFERTWAKAAMRCQLAGMPNIVITKADFDSAAAEKEFKVLMDKKPSGFGFRL